MSWNKRFAAEGLPGIQSIAAVNELDEAWPSTGLDKLLSIIFLPELLWEDNRNVGVALYPPPPKKTKQKTTYLKEKATL